MDINKVKKNNKSERKIYRANLRLTKTQRNFILTNDLSVQAIFEEALKELETEVE